MMSSTSHQKKFSRKSLENSDLTSKTLYSKKFISRFGISAISAGILTASFGMSAAFGATATVNLDAASPFAVLAGSTVTNTGPSTITGDVGLSPGTSITGFPPATATGTLHAADGGAANAQTSLTAAYLDVAGRPSTASISADLAGSTLTPGVYTASSSMGLTGAVTLDGGGDNNAVFIFQAGSTLTTGSSSSVILENGAQACNVFWQVGSSATIGTTTSFVGSILALTSITLNNGATLQGRALARNGAVTLDSNAITVPECAAVATTTSTSPTASTTTTPVIPTGAPGTGFGGLAAQGSSFAPVVGALVGGAAVLGAAIALTLRRRRTES